MLGLRKIATGVVVVLAVSACAAMLAGCGSSDQKAADSSESASTSATSESESSESSSSFSPISLTLYDGDVKFDITSTNGWEDSGKTYIQFNVNVENEGSEVDGWSVDIPFNGKLSVSDCWDSQCSVDDSTLTLSNDEDNGDLASGDSADGVGFIVSGGSNLAIFM